MDEEDEIGEDHNAKYPSHLSTDTVITKGEFLSYIRDPLLQSDLQHYVKLAVPPLHPQPTYKHASHPQPR